MHVNKKKKDTLIFGKEPAQGLDDSMLKAEAQYFIDFIRSN